MLMDKEIVTIASKGKDLLFQWNFNTPTNPISNFHAIIIYHNIVQDARIFVKDYIEQMKQGDFYSIFYVNSELVFIRQPWTQKKNTNELNIHLYIPDNQIFSQLRNRLIEVVQQQSDTISNPVIVSILLQHSEDANWFINKIKSRRIHNKLNCVACLFGPFQASKFSVSEGINQISICEENRLKMINYSLNLVGQAVILRARITVTCLNGDIISCDQREWRNADFNQIIRDYYGLSARYNKDILSFINCLPLKSSRMQLLVEVNYHSFNKAPYKKIQKIPVDLEGGISCSDFSFPERSKYCFIDKDVEMMQNPHKSRINIKFMPGIICDMKDRE